MRSAVVWCSVLQMLSKLKWLMVFFRHSISSLVSCLIVLIVPEEGVLESATMVLALSISAFNFVSFSCIYLEGLLLGTSTLINLVFS